MLRCYDNRIRQTDRCTTIYENSHEIFLNDKQKRQMVCPTHVYADKKPKQSITFSRTYIEDFIWTFNGTLKIIEVPFVDGDHRPRKVGDFLPIIEELTQLHRKSFVHGDIRLFNMVFSDEGGPLIDFDFGGECCKQKYPT